MTVRKRNRPSRLYRWIFGIAEQLIAMSMLLVIFVQVLTFRFGPIGAIYLPLIVATFSFSSLLFNRSRAYTRGRTRTRSLYAAERSMQGAFYLLIAGLLGVGLYGVFLYVGFTPVESLADLRAKHAWLLVFVVPFFLVIPGLVCLRLSIQTAAMDFLGTRSPTEIRRRIRDGLGE